MIDLYIENKSINQIYRDLTLKEEIIRKNIINIKFHKNSENVRLILNNKFK
jgi:ribosomal protein S6